MEQLTSYHGLPHHNRYPYSPITERSKLTWPNGKRLAVYFALNVEHFAYGVGLGPGPSADGAGGSPQRAYAWRDYGVRIGVWRLFDLFDSFNFPLAVLLNAYAALEYPAIVDRVLARGDEVVAHGRTNSERLDQAWDHDQFKGIVEATSILANVNEESRPRGWMSPGRSEGPRTLELLARAGYEYVLDWPMDDQPIWLKTDCGDILSVPYPLELNDLPAQVKRGLSVPEFEQMMCDQFLEMLDQSEDTRLVLGISLHTFLSGQPHQVRALRRVLSIISEHKNDVWMTTPGEISATVAAEEGERR